MQSTYLNEPVPYRIMKADQINFYAHFHQQVEVAYCIGGEMQLLIDGTKYVLYANDAAVIFPNQRHYYYPSENEGDYTAYLLLFFPSHTESFYMEWMYQKPDIPILRSGQLPDFLSGIWEQFYQVYTEQPELYLFKAYVSLLTAHMLPRLSLQRKTAESLADEEGIQTVLNYVNQNFTGKCSLASAAKELGFSVSGLSRLFSKKIGCGFWEYVNSLRISHAKRLLRSSSYSVQEIRFLSGFPSKRTFFRNFQKSCRMTPGEYREEQKKSRK